MQNKTGKRVLVNWDQDKVKQLIELYLDNIPMDDIGGIIGVSYASTKAKITALRKSGVDLPYRDTKLLAQRRRETIANGGKPPTEFDREYQGAVPFGHWTITKPWRVS